MLPKGPYKAQKNEEEILEFWNENQYYKPEYDPIQNLVVRTEEMKKDSREPFCIINPPPNAYARPHIGNVSGYAYQDVFGRYARLNGKKVLLLPGKDHAGQEGEAVFIKTALKPKGKSKKDFTREDFFKACYKYNEENMELALKDEKRVGLSADFDRNIFTLDPKIVPTILNTFKKMYEQGMVYKGVRIINWSPGMKSAVSDNDTARMKREVDFTTIKYPLWENGQASKDKFIEVSTTRPETMLGDTAVVVDPTDERYVDLIGTYVMLPLVNRKIPIIANGKVDKEFGTGAVKLTPAHAPEDYYMMLDWNILSENLTRELNKNGQVLTEALGYVDGKDIEKWKEIREEVGDIDYINIIWKDGKICGPTGKYNGMTVEEAKEKVLEDLNKLNLISKVEKIEQNVTICDRTKTVVEPIMSSQWFIDVNKEEFRQNVIKVLENGLKEDNSDKSTRIHPSNMVDKALHWLNNLRDWPISRSIWWGYRIPVWYKGEPFETVDESGKIVQKIGDEVVTDLEQAFSQNLVKVQIEKPEGEEWIQDNDCLDTWFSSGQWPLATLKAWGLEDTFYPTSVMETGYDILEVWVCRMIMFGMYASGKVPFRDVYLHGLIKAEDGQKMSKSKGNVVSTDEIIDKYGADTLRMFYISGNKAGAAYRVDWEKMEGNRRFLNKLWNASKFVLMNLQDFTFENDIVLPDPRVEKEEFDRSMKKVLDQLEIRENQEIIKHLGDLYHNTTRLMDGFNIGIALQELTNEFWHSFCDIHIEDVKKYVYTQKDRETGEIISEPKLEEKLETQKVLYIALRTYLIMLHPFVPFITERIYQSLPLRDGESKTIMYAKW